MTTALQLAHYTELARQAEALPVWANVPALLRKIRHEPTVEEMKAVLTTLGSIIGDLDHTGHSTGWDEVGVHIDLALEKCDSVYLVEEA